MISRDVRNYDIEYRIKNAMALMKVIEEFATNDIEKQEADYCYHKLDNLLTTIMASQIRGEQK